jgi:BlaI family transcriptional regulator, penicillinase repressor
VHYIALFAESIENALFRYSYYNYISPSDKMGSLGVDGYSKATCKKHIRIVASHTRIRLSMKLPKLTKLELQIMEALWSRGQCAIREIQEAFPKRNRPAYSTIQTTVYRLEGKRALRRVKKISHAHIFEASISREQAQGRLIDDLLSLLGDRLQPVMAHLTGSRKFTLQDMRDAEQALLALPEQGEKEEKK